MRVQVIGSRGQLGTDMLEALAGLAENSVLGLDIPEIDITYPHYVELV